MSANKQTETSSAKSQTTSTYVLERRLHPELRDIEDIERLLNAEAKRQRKMQHHEEKKS